MFEGACENGDANALMEGVAASEVTPREPPIIYVSAEVGDMFPSTHGGQSFPICQAGVGNVRLGAVVEGKCLLEEQRFLQPDIVDRNRLRLVWLKELLTTRQTREDARNSGQFERLREFLPDTLTVNMLHNEYMLVISEPRKVHQRERRVCVSDQYRRVKSELKLRRKRIKFAYDCSHLQGVAHLLGSLYGVIEQAGNR